MLNPAKISPAQREAILSGDKNRGKQVILNSPGMAFVAPEMEAAAAPSQMGAAAAKGTAAAEGAVGQRIGAAQASANQEGQAANSASSMAAMSDKWRQNQHAARIQSDPGGLNGDRSIRSGFQPEVAKKPGSPSAPLPDPQGKAKANDSKSLSQKYREVRQQAKQLKDQSDEGGMGKKALNQAANQLQQQTSKLLQEAWLNLIDSFGATLIWLNIHWFLTLVMGDKLFCKMGHEWIPSAEGGAKAQGKMPGGSFLNLGYDGLGIVEKGVILLLDIIVICLIIGDIVMYALIGYMVTHPGETIWAAAGSLGDFFKIVAAAFNLIVP